MAELRTARADEIARFDAWSATWWDARGPMRPLHVTQALRGRWVRDAAERHFGRPLAGLRVLDVGCGGGLMSEALARAGADVVGIDASAGNIGAARRHAAASPEIAARLDYRHGEPATALRPDERFDLVLALEVVEHVADVAAFVAQVGAAVAPGALMVASTINRTWRSALLAIGMAEYVLRVLPVGTHRWRQFVTPDELEAAARVAGLQPQQRLGMRYLPLLHRAHWTHDTSVNYLASFTRPAGR
ncbi:bifunctional 2-polyprenyl-6-hydroxyphenol methylase/3-demethylubiquinol 3-O-methyltransferase UbiG [Pelomonas cellulosilytica]|uniref:Ubiquinone biosynthesis O-methyltransferase n=1 Tax=Pelomonas cellulosilytica TaxID=2906762 RepID=A0ABS8XWZ8_9BURK|nr:bifunctional 2-polyprenyl-6-hydroxyphenol methylase/3-demethylubiquinol 3-O-methyltransferase UbiG [Pelomonas sp. P8]MCE4556327.1 bifunctional 2-polyprenyl-6-hydroxyphenol methylase/3-demethylubiquinol 3-O-methyltransferase UbiG [Pelomonas sp. P8]